MLPLAFAACGEKQDDSSDAVAANTDAPGQTAAGGQSTAGGGAMAQAGGSMASGGGAGASPSAGGANGPGGATQTGDGASGPGGQGASGPVGANPQGEGASAAGDSAAGDSAAGDSAAGDSAAGNSGPGPAGAGGSGGVEGPSGPDPDDADPSGDSGAGGASGDEPGGAGGTDAEGPTSDECTRDLLDGLLDDYFMALSAGDPSSLPLAAGVKFTENADQAEVGATDFWMNAGDVKYSQRALDTEQCSVAAQAVVPEGGTDLPIAIRIKVEAGEMTEIETIVVRQGDYTASFAVASDPAAIIAIADSIGWHDEVPEADRATREELSSWIDNYFRSFPNGVCNTTSDCRRLENGGGNFSCGGGASCSMSNGQGGTFAPRVIVVDEVRGIAAGLTVFEFMSDGHLDMHMMKMSGGQVHAVHAMLRDTDGRSGWE